MNNNFIFKPSKFYKKNIGEFSKNLKIFFKKNSYSVNKLKILDFGCGNCTLHKFLKFKTIYLYDPNLEAYKIKLSKNFKFFKTYENFTFSNVKFDAIILNSVVQYIEPNVLKKIIPVFLKKLNKKGIVIISDIPDRPRLLELLNIQNWIISLRLLFYFIKSKKYFGVKFFYYKKNFFKKIFLNKKILIKNEKNFNLMQTRYSVIIKNNAI